MIQASYFPPSEPSVEEFSQLFGEIQVPIEFDVPLALKTTLRAGGRAAVYLEPRNAIELALSLETCDRVGLPVRILGAGSNLVIGPGRMESIVISTRKMDLIQRVGTQIEVGAGAPLIGVIRRSMRWGLSGLETLAGIPASIGGAMAMNAGGKYAEFGDFVTDVDLVSPEGQIDTVPVETLKLGYRHSELGGRVVAAVRLQLDHGDPSQLQSRYYEILQEKQFSQPLDRPTAGCIFKNPRPQSAGALIDRAGLKGFRIGGARVSKVHANFIENIGQATARDVLSLMRDVRTKVYERFGTQLLPEVVLW
ncbi:MAG: UDP-N-acetylmuramate dehydrogenase [Planctomycetota bacterium]|jgi:UDP-N-acetylmuramate dehydrogenase|nr:UDP-N-acetylmuramate dehydrogenase [Planctomycetota bacterium]